MVQTFTFFITLTNDCKINIYIICLLFISTKTFIIEIVAPVLRLNTPNLCIGSQDLIQLDRINHLINEY